MSTVSCTEYGVYCIAAQGGAVAVSDQELWLQFRARLASALRRKDLKQYELAKLVGVSPSSVVGWLKEGSIPHGENLMRVARVLGMEPHDLVPESGRAAPTGPNPRQASERLTGGRDALDEVELALRAIRARWEQQDASAKGSLASSAMVKQAEAAAQAAARRARRSKGS